MENGSVAMTVESANPDRPEPPEEIECSICGQWVPRSQSTAGKYMWPPVEGRTCPDCVERDNRASQRRRNSRIYSFFSRLYYHWYFRRENKKNSQRR